MAISPERWHQVEALYHRAAEQPADQRSAWLADACAGDAELLREVESLLAHASATGIVDVGAHDVVAALASARSVTMAPGRRIGVYEIQAPIGAGGMGEVYRARDTRLGREVAIKILSRAFATDSDRLARFEHEARVLAALNHPNIATIHGLKRAMASRRSSSS